MALSLSESRKIAARYVDAFFDVALGAKKEDAVAGDLDGLATLITESDELKQLTRNPMISDDDKQKAFAAILKKAKADKNTESFVSFLIEKKRLEILPVVAAIFRERLVAHKGEVTAEVTTAHDLSDKQIKSIAAAVKKAVGKDANIVTKVNPDILGGVIITIGSTMLDHSVAGRLQRMTNQLKTASLAS